MDLLTFLALIAFIVAGAFFFLGKAWGMLALTVALMIMLLFGAGQITVG